MGPYFGCLGINAINTIDKLAALMGTLHFVGGDN